VRFFPNSPWWVRYDAARDTMIVLLALLVSAVLAFGGGCDAFRNGQALQVLGAASRVAGATQECLRALLAAESKACASSGDPDACQAEVATRWASLARDVDVIRAASCADGGEAATVFAGTCEP